jgi:hypothetical protein
LRPVLTRRLFARAQTQMAAVSSFVGTPLAVRAPTRTASRQQFCVQNNANAAGPKKV